MYWLVKMFYTLFHCVPLSWALFFGKCIGLIFYCQGKKRRAAWGTIKQVFPYKTPGELRSIIRGSFLSFGMSLVETLLIDRALKYVEGKYREKLPPGGGVIVGIHHGSWELYNAWFAQKFPYAILVQRQKHASLNRFLNKLRAQSNITLCETAKELIAFLKRDYWIGLVVDHGAEENAEVIDFFGHIIPVPGGAVRIAKRYHKKIYPSFGVRCGRKHLVKIGQGIDTYGKDEAALLREIHKVYEHFLIQHPEQYLWSYKLFKRKKNRGVLILSDGKAGHLKQSLSVLSFLKKSEYRIDQEIIEVKYRNRFMRKLAEFCALSSGQLCLGCGACLKYILAPETYSSLSKTFFDIVVSTGSSTAPVNVLASRLYGARSCVVLKPNVPLRKFDVAFLPEHDKVTGQGVFTIKGALASFDKFKEQAERGRRFFALNGNRKIAFFAGNFKKNEEMFSQRLKLFLKKLKEFSTESNFSILATTSRRTSSLIERIIEEELKEFKNTEVFIQVSKKNYPFVVSTFFHFSEIIFITAESISMISESAYLNKTTVCVFLEEIKKEPHRRFLDSLKDEFVNFSEYPYNKFEFKKPSRSLKEENDAVLQEGVKRLL